MADLSYTVTEANGLRKYRCSACGSELTYPIEKIPPEFLRVARELQERHCRRECRGLLQAVKPPPT